MDALTLSDYLRTLKILTNRKYENSNINQEMSLIEVRLLMQLYRDEKHEMQTLKMAENNNVTLAAIMHKMKNLEQKGYIKKNDSELDRRIKLYSLTGKGLAFAEYFRKRIENFNERLLLSFDESEVEALEKILKKIISFMEED